MIAPFQNDESGLEAQSWGWREGGQGGCWSVRSGSLTSARAAEKHQRTFENPAPPPLSDAGSRGFLKGSCSSNARVQGEWELRLPSQPPIWPDEPTPWPLLHSTGMAYEPCAVRTYLRTCLGGRGT